LPETLDLSKCLLLILAAMGIGVSKSGFAGVSMIHVLIFAFVFGAKDSTGVLLPMLVIGDVLAIWFFGKRVEWKQVQRLLPPALLGVVLGTLCMGWMNEDLFRPTVGIIILLLTVVQVVRLWRPKLFDSIPHELWFAWTLGLLAGMTTMMANAAGPVVALYLLAVSMPKLELVATSAWFFLTINVFKLPFSWSLGLISLDSLWIDVIFAPGILVGMLVGRWMVNKIPQRQFDSLLLAFTAIAALRLIGVL
jgi:uncharacterized membrane protein YfcA